MTADQVSAYSVSRLPLGRLPPTIIFHGTKDTTVPIGTSRDFCARALAAKRTCELVEYPDLGAGGGAAAALSASEGAGDGPV